jgi:rod shape-determining protein MreB and related proteins
MVGHDIQGAAPKQRIWAVGGGKGGIGKSHIAANFAISLACLGKNVVAVDLDLGNANMHTCFGIRYPQRTLSDFISGECRDLNELLIDTSIYNLKFISGSGGIVGSANPWHAQKLKLLRYLEKLRVDDIVLDLGAGTSYNIIDFFLGASDHILVTTPETPSIQSVYNFMRICLFRKLYAILHKNNRAWNIVEKAKTPSTDGSIVKMQTLLESVEPMAPESIAEYMDFLKTFSPTLVMNMVMKKDEVKLGTGLTAIIKRYLDVDVRYVGGISFDKEVRKAIEEERPYLLNSPRSQPAKDFVEVAPRIMGANSTEATIKDRIQREVLRLSKSYGERVVEAEQLEVDPAIYVTDRVKSAEAPKTKETSGFFSFKANTWSKIAIDIGTTSTRIYVKGRGIVIHEPTLMSIEENTGKVVALGYDTKAMIDRAHSGIRIVAPLESGAITDYADVKKLVQEFIKRAKRSTILIRPGVVLTIPMGLTSVERKAVQEFITELGAREIHLVYGPFAAAVGAGLPVDVPTASMLVNIGGGSISAVVISISGIVTHAVRRIGSNDVDKAITRYLRDTHNFMVGNQTAEWIKINYAQATKVERDHQFTVRGQDVAQGIPKTLSVSTREIREAIAKPVNDIVAVIQRLLESVPPELSGDLVDRGMVLTGGGSYLKGMDKLITDTTGIGVRIALNATTAAVEGAGRMLDDFSTYKKFFVENVETHTE